MPSESLRHETAMALAATVFQEICHRLHEDEYEAEFEKVYLAAKAALTHFERQSERTPARVTPSVN